MSPGPSRDEVARAHRQALNGLLSYKTYLLGELRRVDAAVRVMEGQRQPRRSGGGRGTWFLLRAMINELGDGTWFDIDEALEWVKAHGWETDAVRPRQAIGSALAQMAVAGELRKGEDRGQYAAAPAAPR